MTISTATLLGGLFTLLIALIGFTVNYIINSFKGELQQDRIARAESMKTFGEKVDKVEKFIEKVSDEIFPRLNTLEKSLNGLWREHNLFKNLQGCDLHVHRRTDNTSNGSE